MDIRTHLYPQAFVVNKGRQITLDILNSSFKVPLTDAVRIFELEAIDIRRNFPSKSVERIPRLRGFTFYNDGRIYLHKDNWCIKTIYHEMLHLCSRTSSQTSKVRIMTKKHRGLFEGLTELLAGYVLSKTYWHSYHNCWQGEGLDLCKMTYYPQAALWATFCSRVPLSDTFGIYFQEGNKNWYELTKDFENKVQSSGFLDFSNPFDDSDISGEDRLTEECINMLGGDVFESRYKSNKRHVDFDLIRI